MSDRKDELFEKRMADCLDEYDSYIFEVGLVNDTIANSLEKNITPP